MRTIFTVALFFLISNQVNGGILNHKPFFCNYDDGVLKNPNLLETGDPCLEGGSGKYNFILIKNLWIKMNVIYS